MLGLDGCRHGWVAVVLDDGVVVEVAVVARVTDAVARWRPAVTAIDIPIGFVDDGPREADLAARRALPGRAASVFAAPPRAVVDLVAAAPATTHAEASALAVAVSGRGLSQQSFRLVPKIVEVDAAVADGLTVHEVHPEVAFATLTGAPLPRKTSWAGLEARRAVLERHGLALPTDFPGAARCAPDDVVDAAVCAHVADGVAADAPLRRLPDTSGQHDRGRRIEIVARRPAPDGGDRSDENLGGSDERPGRGRDAADRRP